MTIGLKNLVYATITQDKDGTTTYGTPKKMAEIITADMSVTVAEGLLYADDAVSESVKEFVKGVLKLGVKDLDTDVIADLLGQTVSEDKIIYAGETDEPPYVAVGFRAKKKGATYRYVWLYKVKFKIPNEKFQTKGEAIQFNTPEIEGEFIKREDGLWKADYTGLETDEVAKAFLAAVKEPEAA